MDAPGESGRVQPITGAPRGVQARASLQVAQIEKGPLDGEAETLGAELGLWHQFSPRIVPDAGVGTEFAGVDRSPLFAVVGLSVSLQAADATGRNPARSQPTDVAGGDEQKGKVAAERGRFAGEFDGIADEREGGGAEGAAGGIG